MELQTEKWGRVKELFEGALQLEPSSRRRFLEKESGSAELCNIVEKLLVADAEAGSFLDHNAGFADFSRPIDIPNRLTPGTVLVDRFEIVRFIARGGMGEVYEAYDLELQAPIAIKTIRPEIAGSAHALARFKREVHLAKQVTHPNVCRIFDFFRHRTLPPAEGDVIFVGMELIHGQTLAERLNQIDRISEKETLDILRQIVTALEVAHVAGILHRDLKPGNIMLEPGKNGGVRAVITDFGLARSLDSDFDTASALSGPLAFGTPEYMSPEQIQGLDLTPASDLYSLGLVIYRMIAGVRAFDEDSPLLAALRRLNESPPPPSRIVPAIGPRWDFIVSRCLNPDPAGRFSSARQLAAALDERAEIPPPTATKKRYAGRTWFPLDWQRKLALCAVVGSLLLAVAGVFFLVRRDKPPAPASLTVVLADFVNTTGETIFDDTLNTALYVKLQQSPFLNLMPDAKVQLGLRYMGVPANQRLTRALARQVCLRESGQAVLQGTVSTGPSGYDFWLRAYDCATDNLIASQKVSAGARESALTALDEAATAMRAKLGESLGSIRKYDVPLVDASTPSLDALTAYATGLRLSNQRGQVAAEPDFLRAVQIDPQFAIADARLSSIYADMGEPDRARQAAIRAYEHRDRTSAWERFFILSCYYAFATGQLDKEMQTYREWGSIYPRDTVWPTGLMIDYSYFGQFDRAEEMARLQIRNDSDTAAAYGNLAQIYLAEERPDEAAAILDEADGAHLHEINLNWERYLLGFYNRNPAAMSAQLAHAADYPGLEETLLEQQASTEAYSGRMDSSRAYMRRAMRAATDAGDGESAAVWQAEEALWETDYGMTAAAQADIRQALSSPASRESKDVKTLAALADAASGNEREAQALADRLAREHPLDTLLLQYWLPMIRARIALHGKNPAAAVKLLESTTPFETGVMDPLPSMYAVYTRALARQAAGQNVQAAADFRLILAHRGLLLNSPLGTLSGLGLARSLAQLHDAAGSRLAYRNLLAEWQDADRGSALPHQAALEYNSLP